jgi:hypothetical protein
LIDIVRLLQLTPSSAFGSRSLKEGALVMINSPLNVGAVSESVYHKAILNLPVEEEGGLSRKKVFEGAVS